MWRRAPLLTGSPAPILVASKPQSRKEKVRGSHGRPHSSRESSQEQDGDSRTATSRVEQNSVRPIETGNWRKRRLNPPGGEKAERRGRGHLTWDLLAWERPKNIRDRQLKFYRGKFAGVQEEQVWTLFFQLHSSIFDAEDMWASVERWVTNGPSSSLLGKKISCWSAMFWCCQRDWQSRKRFHYLLFGHQDLGVWLVIQKQSWPTWNLLWNEPIVGKHIGFFTESIDPMCNPVVVLFARE